MMMQHWLCVVSVLPLVRCWIGSGLPYIANYKYLCWNQQCVCPGSATAPVQKGFHTVTYLGKEYQTLDNVAPTVIEMW